METNLTRTEILAMTPDQLRLAVAEYAMGLSIVVNDSEGGNVKFPDGQYYYVGSHYYIDSLLKMPQDIPDYPRDISAAWMMHKLACGWIFSKRHRYFDELHHLVSKRMSVDLLVSWPDIFAHVEPEDFC